MEIDMELARQSLIQGNLKATEKKVTDIKNNPADEQRLKEACQGFEAIFINTVLKSMRKSLPGDAVFPESNGMNIYRSMYDQYLSDHVSKSGSPSGIGEYLYNQLKESI